MPMRLPIRLLSLCLLLFLWTASAADTLPVTGLRENTPDAYCLVGAKIVVGPGQEISSGTIVIRDGKIAVVASGDAVPPGARRVDLSGKVVYPGFIESYTGQRVSADLPGPAYWNDQIGPQQVIANSLKPDGSLNESLRAQGFGARLVAPQDGIVKGQSALVLTSDDEVSKAMVDDFVALHIRLTAPLGRRSSYPTSPMGAVALARQACYDAQWYKASIAAAQADPSLRRPEANLALHALGQYLDGGGLVIADAPNELYVDRADRFAREFSLRLAILGSGKEYRRLEEVRKTQRPVIVPVDFPKPPEVTSPERAASVSLEDLMHWYLAPENPGRLAGAGVRILLTTSGLKKRTDFLAQLRKAIERGLSREDALRALTMTPAEVFGASGQLGSIEVGKIANLVVADGDLFGDGKILATWVNGKPYEIKKEPVASFIGTWKLTANTPIGQTQHWRLRITGKPEKPSAKIGPYREAAKQQHADDEAAAEAPAKAAGDESNDASPDDVEDSDADGVDDAANDGAPRGNSDRAVDQKIDSLSLAGYRLTGSFPGSKFEADGQLSFTATLLQRDQERQLAGRFRLADGVEVSFSGVLEEHQATEDSAQEVNEEKPDGDADSDAGEEPHEKRHLGLTVDVNYPLGAFGVERLPEQEDVALVNATVWTCGADSVLEGAAVLVQSGRIAAVGHDIELPESVKTIDCAGRHVTPGIIDCHSHAASDGGMNEIGQAITAEVRIGDFIDPNDITIYRQLAGGVTAANLLHGSANPIGGQCQLVKFRWGDGAEGMKVHEAPPGIKFALGENVKRSNWSAVSGRYPQSRMGVDELMVDAFRAAMAYRGERRRWERDRSGLPPRRDLELDAILELLEHKRWIHCHSYRQSEVLALLRTLELFNVRVGTLQHILEGYKVTPELAAHGAMGSCFSDWWAYKFEVYDAIPHNGALMHQAGIVVSFNSDNPEMGRRLNQEAAKAAKYGGVPPEEALKFVTLNVARQLRIDDRMGSVEPGKDADLVVWSGPPLSNFSRCEQTWIDGRLYFDLQRDQKMRERDERLRSQLIQAILVSGQATAKEDEKEEDLSNEWPRYDEYCTANDDA